MFSKKLERKRKWRRLALAASVVVGLVAFALLLLSTDTLAGEATPGGVSPPLAREDNRA
ncbi:MAG: hypothetical protein RIE22_11445 [Alphaproteobacteria bacterium]